MLLLLMLVTSCAAIPQNLQEKMFTFPEETNTAHVRLTTSRHNFNAMTVCFRFLTDLKRQYALFSLAVPSFPNGFLFYKNEDSFELCARDKCQIFEGLDFQLNKWHSVCGTWDAASGLVQVWLNGQHSSRKPASGHNIYGPVIIILGQDQDSYAGGFDVTQSFVGLMSDLHMWNYKLSPCEIRKYTNDGDYTKGNMLNWNSLDFQIIGSVQIENSPKHCQ
ncbi:serum amyloid P-component-like isoform X1 [Poecilia reticulata]|uniref:Pentraxin family member n=1 Tax=Poecilia reticulata TaxID=8081 RepID=A0A3P9Q4E7_POERE|nr:PREDICTED: serum amyloid P-component-like isoform X1 [Poecilia reticulata]